ncbi:hypothetical protein NDU88_001236 [Pleurodeles waltl]|uniref:Uncharacterized protein n=1 Tax=Pleurodeles waltl TaxID=8319 RepID=A0AAV7RB23_PLEWA|nr:hypothetical protein NDU88_001236 [Pleurodeles waltl]
MNARHHMSRIREVQRLQPKCCMSAKHHMSRIREVQRLQPKRYMSARHHMSRLREVQRLQPKRYMSAKHHLSRIRELQRLQPKRYMSARHRMLRIREVQHLQPKRYMSVRHHMSRIRELVLKCPCSTRLVRECWFSTVTPAAFWPNHCLSGNFVACRRNMAPSTGSADCPMNLKQEVSLTWYEAGFPCSILTGLRPSALPLCRRVGKAGLALKVYVMLSRHSSQKSFAELVRAARAVIIRWNSVPEFHRFSCTLNTRGFGQLWFVHSRFKLCHPLVLEEACS